MYIYVYSLALVLSLCKPRVIDLLMRFRASYVELDPNN